MKISITKAWHKIAKKPPGTRVIGIVEGDDIPYSPAVVYRYGDEIWMCSDAHPCAHRLNKSDVETAIAIFKGANPHRDLFRIRTCVRVPDLAIRQLAHLGNGNTSKGARSLAGMIRLWDYAGEHDDAHRVCRSLGIFISEDDRDTFRLYGHGVISIGVRRGLKLLDFM